MEERPNELDVMRLLSDTDEFKVRKKKKLPFDFHAMPNPPHEIWQIQLYPKHYQLGLGRTAKPGSPAASERGERPVYHLQFLVKIGPHMAH